jgi:hypothetical protein
MYEQAPAAKAEIDAAAQSVADQCGGAVSKAPLKSKDRALQKIMLEYDGNASKIKDLARNTIVVPAGQEMAALEALKKTLGPKIQSIKIVKPEDSPCGFSGMNVSVKTASGLLAEIQINNPEMIYANMPKDVAKSILSKDAYDKLASDPNLPEGGLGHKFYEQWRTSPPGSPEATQAANQSKEYLSKFRR